MFAWLEEFITFPADFEFFKYIIAGVLIIVCVSLAFGFITSTFSAIFNRK